MIKRLIRWVARKEIEAVRREERALVHDWLKMNGKHYLARLILMPDWQDQVEEDKRITKEYEDGRKPRHKWRNRQLPWD